VLLDCEARPCWLMGQCTMCHRIFLSKGLLKAYAGPPFGVG